MDKAKTVAIRYSVSKGPLNGTIPALEEFIEENGYVWFGKFGKGISEKAKTIVLSYANPKILLMRNGQYSLYWAYIQDISFTTPELDHIHPYYHSKVDEIECWYKIIKIEKADKTVWFSSFTDSGKSLSQLPKYNMTPYYIIEYYNF